jgi:hydroxymethylpyrimidine pyrophosphatase-like HAD family hydrolase
MRYLALCCDYDGTIAHHGRVDEPTLAALKRLRESGRQLVLVTGRELDDLQTVFPHLDLFARSSRRMARCCIGPRLAKSSRWMKRRHKASSTS